LTDVVLGLIMHGEQAACFVTADGTTWQEGNPLSDGCILDKNRRRKFAEDGLVETPRSCGLANGGKPASNGGCIQLSYGVSNDGRHGNHVCIGGSPNCTRFH
jgi:hypothetical protein